MKKIGDISKHQPTSLIHWPVFGKQFDLLFIRVQYGSTGPDKEYASHTANAVAHGVPFYSYAFPRFVSVADAVVEATDATKRQHAKSLGMVLDIENEKTLGGSPAGISKLPKGERLEAIKAFVAQCRKLGVKRVGAYVGHNIYADWDIESVIGLFDFVWIPRYGEEKPDYPCHIWQHTESGRVDGYSRDIDLNILIGDKPIEWFTGEEVRVAPVPAPSSTPSVLMTVRAIGAGDIRSKPDHTAGFIRNTIDGEVFKVYAHTGDWHCVNTDGTMWIDGNGGRNLYWVDNPAVAQYYTVKSGDTLGKIAAKYGTTVAGIQKLNGLKDVNRLAIGQKLRIK
jgi:hypothetical protein